MRLGVKLAILLACASAAPLTLATIFTLPSGQRELRGQLDQIHSLAARELADQVQRVILDKLDALTLATRSLRLATLDHEARQQALLLIYQQTKGADVVGLFDETGDAVVSPVHFDRVVGEGQADHEEIGAEALAAYASNVPLKEVLRTRDMVLGPPYVLTGRGGMPVSRLVLAMPVQGARGARWVLAVELSLRSLAERFARVRLGGSNAFLVDGTGRVIIHPDADLQAKRSDLSGHPLLVGRGDSRWLGASADVPIAGWRVVVQQDADEALAPLRRLALRATFWMVLALIAALGLGLTTVRTVTRPVERLRAAAEAVAAGKLDTQVQVQGRDEMAQLGKAFNEMIRGLRERARLEATLEISTTLELKEVLERLLDGLSRIVPYQRAAVLLHRGDHYRVAVERGYADSEHAATLEQITPGGPVERALRSEAPAIGSGGSSLVVPLMARGDVVGLVALEGSGYDLERARLAVSFTQPAVIAVENARLFDEVQRLATLDGLTGTYNRRHFMDLANLQIESARRFAQPLAAMMLDIDDFKRVNDSHGHAIGDQVLRIVAERVRRSLRAVDILGRTGGEEFAIVLPGASQEAAVGILAERIRKAVGGEPIPTDAGPVLVTISVGVASAGIGCEDLQSLLKAADAALYEAKQGGRNRVAS
jgi:diguanylate cyclase (GGDEF)-like protein